MNVRVALLQIASQHPKSGQNGGGRMPRNPWPDQIGMGGRITPEYASGKPEVSSGSEVGEMGEESASESDAHADW